MYWGTFVDYEYKQISMGHWGSQTDHRILRTCLQYQTRQSERTLIGEELDLLHTKTKQHVTKDR